MPVKEKRDYTQLKITVDILQIIFFVIIGSSTVISLILSYKQNKLIFKPVIGITDVRTTRIFLGQEDKLENVKGVIIQFVIENVGNLPAKNLKIKTTGKLGNTILPHTEGKNSDGVHIIPNAKYLNEATIGIDIIRKMIEDKTKLIYTVELSYADWENYTQYSYPLFFEIYVTKKEPLNLGVKPLSENEVVSN